MRPMQEHVVRLQNPFWTVDVWPNLGANIGRILHRPSGQELLRWPENLTSLSREPYIFGMPLLFPAGRIEGGVCRVGRELWEWPRNDPAGPNHLHGFLWNRPFNVKDYSLTHVVLQPAKITEDLLNRQMHQPLEITIYYRLIDSRIEMRARFVNHGTRPVPFGFGYHVNISLKTPWEVFLPGGMPWVMGKDLMPRHLAQDESQVAELKALPFSVRNLTCDLCYLSCTEDDNTIKLISPDDDSDLQVSISAPVPFRHWVLYRPNLDADFFSIEPYTWVHNAPNLAMDPRITGMRLLDAQDSIETQLSWTCDGN